MNKILEDIRILDLTHAWFGPFCTMMLSDMGAEVIKIEPPWGEQTRLMQPLHRGMSSYFLYLNMGKKGIVLNLKSPKGSMIFKDLVRISDVIVQNFSPGTMEKLGLGYEDLKKINPKIIYASLSGFGQTGPYTNRPSYATVAEAMSGQSRMLGDQVNPDGPPLNSAQAYGDLGPGLFAALSIVSALRFRDKTGKGQLIDIAQLDCMISLSPAILGYVLTGIPTKEWRKKFPSLGVSGFIKASDGYVAVLAPTGEMLDRLAKLVGVDRVDFDAVQKWAENKSVDEVWNALVKTDIPVAPAWGFDRVITDPHVLARNMIAEVEHPELGKMKVPNFPIKFSESVTGIKGAAPSLGQHTKEVLSTVLGYSDAKINELEQEGAIKTAKPK